MRSRLAPLLACALGLAACSDRESAASNEPGSTAAEPEPGAAAGLDGDGVAGPEPLAKQLPPELVAELREQGSDLDGRLLTLASGFIATAACSDCGAPSYLWLLAVRCADPRHCEILTEQCEGTIARELDVFVVELRPVEGGAAEVCAGYTGRFELP